jgi:uncharacterized SAM-binding protein YcdF (DUF218 family)
MVAVLVLLPAVVVALSETAYRLAYRPVSRGAHVGGCAVLVLGYPTESDGNPHPLQRFRVQAGVTAYRENCCNRIVFSGGAVRNQYAEARTMAEIAHGLGVPEHDMAVEDHARTTWENIGCSARYLENAKTVLLVSDSIHAQRAKRYACRQNPSLCSNMVAAGALPPLALLPWSVFASVYELLVRLRDYVVYEWPGAKSAPPCPN